MKISPLNIKNVNFGTTHRTIYKNNDGSVAVSDKYDFSGRRKIVNSNSTTFFRADHPYEGFLSSWSDMAILLKNIDQIMPEGKVNLYDIGCSDGSEAYSLIITLITMLGEEQAQRFFPIKAFDIDGEIIKKAQSKEIFCDEPSKRALEENTNFYVEKYFDIEETKSGYILKAKPILTDNVIFEQKSIEEASKEINSEENNLIFARNMWKYLTPEDAANSISSLNEHMGKKSLLVLGSFDFDMESLNDKRKIPDFYTKAGFGQVSTLRCVLGKRKENKDSLKLQESFQNMIKGYNNVFRNRIYF